MKVIIADYDLSWPTQFEQEKAKLTVAVADHVVAIEHIGSTSIPGLGAKPIIDIMIGVRTLAEADAHCIEPIVSLGYDYTREFERDVPLRRYFRKDNAAGIRTHQIHLVETSGDWWPRHLAFRDYLRAHPEKRDAYDRLKRELATREFASIDDYSDAKTAFIRAVEVEAFAWQRR